jgi:hypothetical protein
MSLRDFIKIFKTPPTVIFTEKWSESSSNKRSWWVDRGIDLIVLRLVCPDLYFGCMNSTWVSQVIR